MEEYGSRTQSFGRRKPLDPAPAQLDRRAPATTQIPSSTEVPKPPKRRVLRGRRIDTVVGHKCRSPYTSASLLTPFSPHLHLLCHQLPDLYRPLPRNLLRPLQSRLFTPFTVTLVLSQDSPIRPSSPHFLLSLLATQPQTHCTYLLQFQASCPAFFLCFSILHSLLWSTSTFFFSRLIYFEYPQQNVNQPFSRPHSQPDASRNVAW
ncbi:hypothetical protein E4T56_gene14184 [Termitomyces sp. T112]|nr:hypothetical protein E4T56_gene14184 [Termitomyces sp. T112]